MKHTLYMLKPWYETNGAGPYYCPDCGVVEGFLCYSPEIREAINIIDVEFPRPREIIVRDIGLENQSSPVLVLSEGTSSVKGARQSMSTGKYFINDALQICNFLATAFNGVKPHP